MAPPHPRFDLGYAIGKFLLFKKYEMRSYKFNSCYLKFNYSPTSNLLKKISKNIKSSIPNYYLRVVKSQTIMLIFMTPKF